MESIRRTQGAAVPASAATSPAPAAAASPEPVAVDENRLRSALERADVEFMLPVYNEEKELGSSVVTLVEYLRSIEHGVADVPADAPAAPRAAASHDLPPFSWRVAVVDNASTDGTLRIARALAEAYPGEVCAVHLDRKGRGRALKQAWLASQARVVAYMDIDLSTDIRHIPQLILPLLVGEASVAIGSRLAPGARVERSAGREFTSRVYNCLLRTYLRVGFSDAQCGFKAVRADAASRLLPRVKDTGWFFDTELLVLAERSGMRIHEVPVRWVEDPGSTVHVVDTAIKDLKGMWRMKHSALMGAGMMGGVL